MSKAARKNARTYLGEASGIAGAGSAALHGFPLLAFGPPGWIAYGASILLGGVLGTIGGNISGSILGTIFKGPKEGAGRIASTRYWAIRSAVFGGGILLPAAILAVGLLTGGLGIPLVLGAIGAGLFGAAVGTVTGAIGGTVLGIAGKILLGDKTHDTQNRQPSPPSNARSQQKQHEPPIGHRDVAPDSVGRSRNEERARY